jgi:hypothetical protein
VNLRRVDTMVYTMVYTMAYTMVYTMEYTMVYTIVSTRLEQGREIDSNPSLVKIKFSENNVFG